jgi:hypothetical protein
LKSGDVAMSRKSLWAIGIAVAVRSSVVGLGVCLAAASLAGQTVKEVRGAVAAEPLRDEPPARIIVDSPLADPLSHGRIVIQYRTENLHIFPVFGPTVLSVSPRVGHIHVSVDDAKWVWADASGEPVVLDDLPPGAHKVLLQAETANHQLLDQGAVTFVVPSGRGAVSAWAPNPAGEPTAKLVIDAPVAEALARGVAFIGYRTENLRIAPLFGPAALRVSPRIGHIHVTVDHASWHWTDATGNPVIVNGLAPGPHTILIQLVNPNHQLIDEGTVQFTTPEVRK